MAVTICMFVVDVGRKSAFCLQEGCCGGTVLWYHLLSTRWILSRYTGTKGWSRRIKYGYPWITLFVYPCFTIAMEPCILVFLCPCILVFLYPCILVFLYPCSCINIPVCLYFCISLHPCISIPVSLYPGEKLYPIYWECKLVN